MSKTISDHKILNEVSIIQSLVLPYLKKLGFQYIDTGVRGNLGTNMLTADIVCYLDPNRSNPFVVVEVKRQLRSDTNIFDPAVQQAFTMATALGSQVRYLLVTDGQNYFWFEADIENQSLIPALYPPTGFAETRTQGTLLNTLRPLQSPNRYLSVLKSIVDILQKEDLALSLRMGIELNRLLIAKLYDEEHTENSSGFRFRTYGLTAEQVAYRIQSLYYEAIRELAGTASEDRFWSLSDDTLYKAVQILEPYALKTVTHVERDRTFWIVFANLLKRDAGQYTTPQFLAKLLIAIAHPQKGDRVVDPACGTGLLLLEAIQASENNLVVQGADIDHRIRNGNLDVKGVEINTEVARLAATNFALNRVDPNLIINANSLLTDQLRNSGIKPNEFDLVLINPPLGTTVIDREVLHTFELAGKGAKVGLEILFIELALRLLKPHGRLVIVIPDTFLSSPSLAFAREWLLRHGHIRALISLPPEAFALSGHAGKASILCIEKKDSHETIDKNALIADIRSIGYDRLGQLAEINDIPELISAINEFHETGEVSSQRSPSGLRIWTVPSQQFQSERLDINTLDIESKSLERALLLGKYPVAKLKDIARIVSGRNFKQYVEKDYTAAMLVQAGSVRDMEIITETSPFISLENFRTAKSAQIIPEDVLVTTTGQYLGRAAVAYNLPVRAVASGAVTILRPKPNVIPGYLAAFITSDLGKEQISSKRAATTAQPYIRRSDLGEILIPIPPINIQKQIAIRVSELRDSARKLREEARLLEEKAKASLVSEVIGGITK